MRRKALRSGATVETTDETDLGLSSKATSSERPFLTTLSKTTPSRSLGENGYLHMYG